MSRRFVLKEAREDRRILLRSNWQDKKALYNHYARNYVYESSLRGVPKSHVACCMMISEKHGIHPQELINEGIWGSIKSFFKKGDKAAKKKDETMDVSEEEIQAYMDSKAGVFDRWKQAKKDGASTWQGLKHAFSGIGSMFQQGQQVWDITGKSGAKLQIQARKGFEKIKKELESDFLEPMMKDLNKALKDPKMGKPEAGGFPNQPRAADFRAMLFGHTRFADLESSDKLGGIFGYMMQAKVALQTAVDNAIIDAGAANAVVKKMVKVLQYYAGALDDTKASLENKGGKLRGDLLTSYSLESTLMGGDYYWSQMLREADEDEDEGGAEVINLADFAADGQEVPEELQNISKEDGDKLAAYFGDPENNEPPGGLSDKALADFKASDSLLKPLLLALMGSIYVSLGISKGGNPLGDFENSPAFQELMMKINEVELTEVPATIAQHATEQMSQIKPEDSKGWLQNVYRWKGWPCPGESGYKPHSLAEIKAAVNDANCPWGPGNMENLQSSGVMKNMTEDSWDILNNAPDDMTDAAWANSLETAEKVSKPVTEMIKMPIDNADAREALLKKIAMLQKHLEEQQMTMKLVQDAADSAVPSDTPGFVSVDFSKYGFSGPEDWLRNKQMARDFIAGDIEGIEKAQHMLDQLGVEGANGRVVPVTKWVETTVATGGPSTGNHPFSMFNGTVEFTAKIAPAVAKAGTKFIARSAFRGAITSTVIGKVALPTILATAGTGMIACGVSIAVLRAAAKSRRKTFKACMKMLEEPIKPNPEAKKTAEEMEKVNVVPATPPDEIETAPPHEELDGILQFPRRELEKSGYPKEEIDDLFDDAFDAEKNADARDALLHKQKQSEKIEDSYSLVGLLLNEDMEFGEMGNWIANAADGAGVTKLSDKNKAHLAMGINVGPDIGEITGLPDAAAGLEAQKELEALKKKLEAMDDEKQKMANDLAQANAQYFLDTQEIEGLNKEVEDLMKGNKSLSEVIEQLEEKVKNGEIAAEDAIKAKENLENQLKAVQLAAEEEQALLQGQINNLKEEVQQYMDAADANMRDLEKIDAFSEEVMGEPLVDILKDPDAFVQRFMDKKEKEQQKVLDDLKAKDKEISSLEDQLKAAQAAEAKKNSYGKIFQYLKKLVKAAKDNKSYKFDFVDPEIVDFMSKKNTSYSDAGGSKKKAIDSMIQDLDKAVLKDMGVRISHPYEDTSSGYTGDEHRSKRKKTPEARWHQGPILAERWAQLAGLPVLNEANHRSMKTLLREGAEYDEMACENYLEDLESGREVMMSEQEYQDLKSFCAFEQIDYVFDAQYYGNGVAVRIIDDYNDYLR